MRQLRRPPLDGRGLGRGAYQRTRAPAPARRDHRSAPDVAGRDAVARGRCARPHPARCGRGARPGAGPADRRRLGRPAAGPARPRSPRRPGAGRRVRSRRPRAGGLGLGAPPGRCRDRRLGQQARADRDPGRPAGARRTAAAARQGGRRDRAPAGGLRRIAEQRPAAALPLGSVPPAAAAGGGAAAPAGPGPAGRRPRGQRLDGDGRRPAAARGRRTMRALPACGPRLRTLRVRALRSSPAPSPRPSITPAARPLLTDPGHRPAASSSSFGREAYPGCEGRRTRYHASVSARASSSAPGAKPSSRMRARS